MIPLSWHFNSRFAACCIFCMKGIWRDKMSGHDVRTCIDLKRRSVEISHRYQLSFHSDLRAIRGFSLFPFFSAGKWAFISCLAIFFRNVTSAEWRDCPPPLKKEGGCDWFSYIYWADWTTPVCGHCISHFPLAGDHSTRTPSIGRMASIVLEDFNWFVSELLDLAELRGGKLTIKWLCWPESRIASVTCFNARGRARGEEPEGTLLIEWRRIDH